MGEGFGQWFFFMYLCIQEKRAVSLSIVRQNGSHKSVKKLLHFCYTTTWTNQLGSCYTTKYERVVHFPLSPPYKGCKSLIYILFSFSHLSPEKQRHPRQLSRVSLRLLRIFSSFRQLLHHLVKITFQPFHLSPAINQKFPLSFFDGYFVRNTSFAFEELTL